MRTRSFHTLVASSALLLLASRPAAAATLPEKDHAAIGGELGLFSPFASEYKLGYSGSVSLDYYLSARFGVRASAAYAQSGTKLDGSPNASNAYFLGQGVYNFDLGQIHPYGALGFGIYRVDPASGGSTGRVGLNLGGGADYFVSRRTAITGELLLHFLASVQDRKASFATLAVGVRYFF